MVVAGHHVFGAEVEKRRDCDAVNRPDEVGVACGHPVRGGGGWPQRVPARSTAICSPMTRARASISASPLEQNLIPPSRPRPHL